MPIRKSDIVGVISNRPHLCNIERHGLCGGKNAQATFWPRSLPFFLLLARCAGTCSPQFPKRDIQNLTIAPCDSQTTGIGLFQPNRMDFHARNLYVWNLDLRINRGFPKKRHLHGANHNGYCTEGRKFVSSKESKSAIELKVQASNCKRKYDSLSPMPLNDPPCKTRAPRSIALFPSGVKLDRRAQQTVTVFWR